MPKSLQKEVNRLLKEYGDAVIDSLDDVLEQTAKDCVETLKKGADTPRRTGKYASAWRYSKRKKGEGSNDSVHQYTVYNGKYWWLTSPLEYGHVNRGGGRTEGEPHIKAAEDTAVVMLEELLIRRIKEIK